MSKHNGGRKTESRGVQQTHPIPRKYLELAQDMIVFGLCAMLLVAMGIKLVHLGELLVKGADFSLVVGDILFILVLVELFRLLLIYLEEHRVSVATMVEVGIVATLREVILLGTLHIPWQHLLVVSVFILSLAMVLRYAGLRSTGSIAEER
ncbi:MAG TPA: phosphate-starvation-inducible PsiE family protein [candidate division Zixibacteria bacterium]|nr:phosphate-starvation-inducible PsiE family protein [candidate division Zixibacteria bacterium]